MSISILHGRKYYIVDGVVYRSLREAVEARDGR